MSFPEGTRLIMGEGVMLCLCSPPSLFLSISPFLAPFRPILLCFKGQRNAVIEQVRTEVSEAERGNREKMGERAGGEAGAQEK